MHEKSLKLNLVIFCLKAFIYFLYHIPNIKITNYKTKCYINSYEET